MASIASLLLVALALSAAVLAVDSAPLENLLQPDVPASPRGNLVIGKRQPGDYLANSLDFVEVHTGAGHTVNICKKIDVRPGQVITEIVLNDQSPAGDTEVSVVEGGPGHGYAILLFRNPQNFVQFSIYIFAK